MWRKMTILAGVLSTACGAPPATAMPAPQDTTGPGYRSTADGREAVTITVYNQNFGLVREIRGLDIARGRVELEYGDVASAIQPETVHIRALDGGRLDVLEQNYRYDLLSPQKLLETYIGRTVTVYRWNPETEREEAREAEVLAVNGGTILRIGDEITFNYGGRMAFPEVPDDLIASPSLVWTLDSRAPRPRVEVSYLANQLNWKADYVMVVGERDRTAGLTGWVTLTNQSGASYDHARLKLVAGDVQRVSSQQRYEMARKMAMAEAADAGFTEEGFFEYHLYTLGRPTTLRNNEQKQVTLLEAPEFGIRKRLIYYGAARYYRGTYGQVESNRKVGVYLDFENSQRNGLGMALPKGIVRVYKRDGSGAQQFIGEDRIDHTPRDETVRIRMGESFDVVGDRRQVDYDVLGTCLSESAWEIELRNHKDEATEVEVFEPVGGDWEILSSSLPVHEVDAHTFRFVAPIQARGSRKIRYRVRVRWC
ncbi:MAG: DUF4139 domain-containing protein [Gemmatimonadota bacterium]